MQLLDGKKAREYYVSLLIDKVKKLSFAPCLAIIQVGSRMDSDSFIKAKKSFAQKAGIREIHVKLDEKVSQNEVIEVIEKYNKDKTAQGIIVQLPLPACLNPDLIINSISAGKDTDGLVSGSKFTPATARGISELLDFYKIDILGKKVTIVGQSKLVGIPIAEMCRKRKAIVTTCGSKTKNLEKETKKADILIVAIGKPCFINEKYIKKDQIVIDVGITRETQGLRGDVDFDNVKDIVKMITPVPGGVGQMTVLALFENLIDACYSEENSY